MSVKNITVAVTGMAQGFAAGARTRVASVALSADALVENVRVRLTGASDPTRAGLVQIGAEVDGRRVRVQCSAAGVGAAAERAADALRQRIADVTGPWRPRPWPWTSAAAAPAASATLPPGQARIARVKTPTLVWCSPDAAAQTMDAMDYDIHLFVDPDTETEAVVYRVGPTGYRVARTVAAGPPKDNRGIPWTLQPGAANRLTDEQAVDRLEKARLPHLFYADPDTGFGRVLYRRFDGHYGLLRPAGGLA
ncbi:sigma 54 modulation/S30EA ribosomal C-terminal domain-containing protein [Yinghuangia seranimata]|uniref:sigma 54 modulation/S30EA ribosomal C-terminal domain-containing protein n=1 Tax=Yinghuangia seranimata TaxID=408067 RepID=UPI00248ACE58|nr:sigma 54 modulation/S30EA ribosomal C-terminal domain-containing protein [Yinghuangia seranimata]MDI2125468.1 sigma 54 modulation/S30EA ribosomal C-terminal domain-containing protein [Yinghuangia seranimata]